ncbi:hypothetical protein [Novosphingobium guangzhouense]|uniref:Uncharacterized protein n=1 Tax=Novosphingobium guangzhouense TaxID=1850347 RepID=A0A2K2G378_9SPHN|nr:hypothetical protein [Novosphingobium guangzhouense]PNU05486.1 hypothetical protein A8V01_15995 [Novosphingobium guangzhouense]
MISEQLSHIPTANLFLHIEERFPALVEVAVTDEGAVLIEYVRHDNLCLEIANEFHADATEVLLRMMDESILSMITDAYMNVRIGNFFLTVRKVRRSEYGPAVQWRELPIVVRSSISSGGAK